MRPVCFAVVWLFLHAYYANSPVSHVRSLHMKMSAEVWHYEKRNFKINKIHISIGDIHTWDLVCGVGLCCLLEVGVALAKECWSSSLSLCPEPRKHQVIFLLQNLMQLLKLIQIKTNKKKPYTVPDLMTRPTPSWWNNLSSTSDSSPPPDRHKYLKIIGLSRIQVLLRSGGHT